MPLYEYECTECGHLTEMLQRMNDPPLAECPQCEAAVKKLLSAPAFQFKGTGWYVTDYAGKGKPDAKSSAKDKAPASEPSASKDAKSPKPASGSPSD